MPAEIPEETLHALLRGFCADAYYYTCANDREKRIDADVANTMSEDTALIRVIRSAFAAGRESVYLAAERRAIEADVDVISVLGLRHLDEVTP